MEKVLLKNSQMHRKSPVPKFLFDKADILFEYFVKKRFQHNFFPVNFARKQTPSSKNTSGRLLPKNFVLNSLILLIDYLIRQMFIHKKCIISGSRTVAPEENYPPTLNLILTITKTLTLTGWQFS